MRERPDPTVQGPTLFAAAVGVMVALAVLVPGPRLGPGWRLAGLLPVGVGAALHWWAWRVFHERGVTVADRKAPEALITSGPYRWSRNPMLLGGVLILAGGGLLLGATTPFAVVPLHAWLCRKSFVLPEERILEERFGAAYDAYRERVGRWI